MRNLKRALSLALAAVMVIGMMVVGAGAVSYDDFSDKDKIVNDEAVSMLVELNVINGKDDGSFDPEGIVTRAEMAKMIILEVNPNLPQTNGDVEIHISDITSREEFRKISVTAPVCNRQIYGQGLDGYLQAIDFLRENRQ